ncbi:amino acid ABC transporter permease [Paenibacillus sp. N1-5-1-14]|uniref:amino acid ABC transporter permease n=1 Tax=Paenibacillus radicibacter TaxID=2972488 RepID=UPI002159B0AC|nr:amino acid ABC transporter permease [Paenibacillus radicibacter]MCR8644036.1 amino acid ABC transporter permease [Paenibacillus radicibacter]
MDFAGAYSPNNLLYILEGFLVTIEVSLIAIVLSFIIGNILGLIRFSKVPVLSKAVGVIVDVIRNVPLILIIFFVFFALPEIGIKMSIFAAATSAITIYASAMLCEIVRGGLNSIAKGQFEAARASGLTYVQTIRYIILPQALRRMIPPILSECTSIFKGTSLAIVISLPDMMHHAQMIYNFNVKAVIPVLLLVSVLYFVVNYGLTRLANVVEKRLSVY